MPRARALPFTNRDEQRLARYSPEFIAAMRHDYEETDLSLAQMAAKHGVSERTVNRMRDRYGWARRSARVRDVAPAVRALQEATRLLVERQEFSLNRSTPAPNSAHSRASGNPEQNAPSSIAALGPRFRRGRTGERRSDRSASGAHRAHGNAALPDRAHRAAGRTRTGSRGNGAQGARRAAAAARRCGALRAHARDPDTDPACAGPPAQRCFPRQRIGR